MNSNQYNQRLAATLKALRDLSCKTQEQIAEGVNMPQCTYSRIERGLRPVNIGELSVIAHVLNIHLYELIKIVEAENNMSGEDDSQTLPNLLNKFIKLFDGKIDHAEMDEVLKQIKKTFYIDKSSEKIIPLENADLTI